MHVRERALWGAMWQIGGKGVLEAKKTNEGPNLGQPGDMGVKDMAAGGDAG